LLTDDLQLNGHVLDELLQLLQLLLADVFDLLQLLQLLWHDLKQLHDLRNRRRRGQWAERVRERSGYPVLNHDDLLTAW
jgi:hypothetical protein